MVSWPFMSNCPSPSHSPLSTRQRASTQSLGSMHQWALRVPCALLAPSPTASALPKRKKNGVTNPLAPLAPFLGPTRNTRPHPGLVHVPSHRVQLRSCIPPRYRSLEDRLVEPLLMAHARRETPSVPCPKISLSGWRHRRPANVAPTCPTGSHTAWTRKPHCCGTRLDSTGASMLTIP